tara:strand:- start:253 stop:447 length:195 start_codon:yes stop_codon:yes gene_type:complete
MDDLEKYEKIKKRLGLSNSDFALMFGYKNPKQLDGNNSSRGLKFKTGIVRFYEKIGDFFNLEEK